MQKISIVVPVYNESAGIKHFHKSLLASLPKNYKYELIFINDGSRDESLKKIAEIGSEDKNVKIINFSRNFGKEAAVTAGILASTGNATIMIDSDGQHPVELIGKFIDEWVQGADVVIGLRTQNTNEGFIKKYGSKIFYKLFNSISKEKIIPGSTDYRLIDESVRKSFSQLREKNRLTRALIDWLGYRRTYIEFIAKAREYGSASYDTKKLIKLAIDSYVSLTTFPLFAAGYLGAVIVPISIFLGLFVICEQYILKDPLRLNITGSASLGIMLLFLVGIVLMCLGFIAMYISKIYDETKNRPLYIIDERNSKL